MRSTQSTAVALAALRPPKAERAVRHAHHRHDVAVQAGRRGAFSSSSRSAKRRRGSQRGEIEEASRTAFLQLPHRVGADEHQRDVRLDRRGRRDSAPRNAATSCLLGGMPSSRLWEQLADRPAAVGARVGRAVVQAERHVLPELETSRASRGSRTSVAGAGCPPRDSAPRIRRAGAPARPGRPAGATGPTPRRRGARSARASRNRHRPRRRSRARRGPRCGPAGRAIFQWNSSAARAIGRELVALAALLVGVEHEARARDRRPSAARCGPTASPVGGRGRQGHGVGVVRLARSARRPSIPGIVANGSAIWHGLWHLRRNLLRPPAARTLPAGSRMPSRGFGAPSCPHAARLCHHGCAFLRRDQGSAHARQRPSPAPPEAR